MQPRRVAFIIASFPSGSSPSRPAAAATSTFRRSARGNREPRKKRKQRVQLLSLPFSFRFSLLTSPSLSPFSLSVSRGSDVRRKGAKVVFQCARARPSASLFIPPAALLPPLLFCLRSKGEEKRWEGGGEDKRELVWRRRKRRGTGKELAEKRHRRSRKFNDNARQKARG